MTVHCVGDHTKIYNTMRFDDIGDVDNNNDHSIAMNMLFL